MRVKVVGRKLDVFAQELRGFFIKAELNERRAEVQIKRRNAARVRRVAERLAILQRGPRIVAHRLISQAAQVMRAGALRLDFKRPVEIRHSARDLMFGKVELAKVEQRIKMLRV